MLPLWPHSHSCTRFKGRHGKALPTLLPETQTLLQCCWLFLNHFPLLLRNGATSLRHLLVGSKEGRKANGEKFYFCIQNLSLQGGSISKDKCSDRHPFATQSLNVLKSVTDHIQHFTWLCEHVLHTGYTCVWTEWQRL